MSGRILEETRENFLTVFSRLQTAGLRLRIEKCSFMKESCVYLGHRLDAEGIHPTDEKLLALQNAPKPKSISALRSYLRMVHYYHKFIQNLSAVLAPLHELLQKYTPWHWGSAQSQAFEESKALLQSSQVLVHYDPRLPLVISCDAPPYGIGAVLSHQMPDGSDKPVAFASRTLAPADRNYAQIEREGLAWCHQIPQICLRPRLCHSDRPPPAFGSVEGGQDDLTTRERKNPAVDTDIVKLPLSPMCY